ncbi:response regulator [Williamsia sp. 1135]|uniref:response regulator n=1 Tax=Williamsia sp. 1135 TaxID=1889262 RepID=UPI000A103EA6|nr:response regulator [Williamsia sp. 1135]ORM37293.1 response regulator [Williamsia sp. 1135]
MSAEDFGVLIVDDDFRVAGLHASIVNAVSGFSVLAQAGTREAAVAALAEHPEITLALIDVHLPDGPGLDLLPRLNCDAFVISAETDSAAVRKALRGGALTYLIKPFENTELARRLSAYAQYRRILATPTTEQSAVDAALGALRTGRALREASDTGSQTEELILTAFDGSDHVMFADEVSAVVGISPPTARRHLANLVSSGKLTMKLRYGATGRPKQEYRRP